MSYLRMSRSVRFLPLDSSAQMTFHSVLYYDTKAPVEAIYSCARGRLEMAMDLLCGFYECKESNVALASTVTQVANVLIGECYSMLGAFDPSVLRYRRF